MAKLDRSRFGPNVWLIDEMYHRYLDNPRSVNDAWQEFFEDYSPRGEQPSAPLATAELASETADAKGKATANGTTKTAPAEPAQVPQGARLLKGTEALVARRMDESLDVPTATSVRVVPAKLLEVNRSILNNHIKRAHGGKVSFTHLIGWAVVKAVASNPGMNVSFASIGGKPYAVTPEHLNLGLAVDTKRTDGERTLVVPNIKWADSLDFSGFFTAYEELIRKVQTNKLTVKDFAATTLTLTNPGMIGTVQSVPRLMEGQGAIIGVGSIGFPAEYQGADERTLAQNGVGKVLTLTSTYDHRVIQGALSGEFLAKVHALLLGEDSFYSEIFASMGVPYVPVLWRPDVNPAHDSIEAEEKQARVFQLINIYRVRGHLIADLDPLDTKAPWMHPELDPATYGLTLWDLDRTFATGDLAGKRKLQLGEILRILRDAYCRTAGIEYMHISDPLQKRWIQDRVEGVSPQAETAEQRWILSRLNEAEAFETFLHKKYVGHKRFSLEGAESLIPMLDAVLDAFAEAEGSEVVIGMSHRGRLNVLANIIHKSYGQIFQEFEGDIDPESAQGSGDVKYHIGAEGVHTTANDKDLAVSVVSNPSHLESVDPVVEGVVRAKQDAVDRGVARVMALLVHGDAAFAGQGVVAETLNMSQLSGYSTGGTVHIVVNNQIGFTTGADYGRSSTYATDIAKMVQAPIFHVNGDDPEACVRVSRLALDFRQRFAKDVVIDMVCYRRWGHNEGDDPSFTQPSMYKKIENRRSVRKLYTEMLVNRGDLSLEEAEGSLQEFRAVLQQAFDETHGSTEPGQAGRYLKPAGERVAVQTGVPQSELESILAAITTAPEGFTVHPKLGKWMKERALAIEKEAIDWSLAEALAFGTLLKQGVSVRMAGQDSRRGTFSQRHAVLVDQRDGAEFTGLAALATDGARFQIYDSFLSEFAALGFEYGYASADERSLVVWEAQFGDFANGAQIIIDQFIAAGEDKWDQASGVVMLLPHGYEGQGPEHSSARLERFLQLGAEDNIRVVVPSTPAQYFHLLRHQALERELRRPLVVLTPKSFLRLPAARSRPADLVSGSFSSVLPDTAASSVDRVLICSGKIYYDLIAERERLQASSVAVLRLEQLYPLPIGDIAHHLESLSGVPIIWVQEEPENMGAWRHVFAHFLQQLDIRPRGIFRRESASPASGSAKVHQWEQASLMKAAFAPLA